MGRFCLSFKSEAADQEFVEARRPLFKKFFIFVIFIVVLVSTFVLLGVKSLVGAREMTIICVPILICIICVLFEKNFRYMEIFTIIICTALHTIIFYYRFKTIESSEDMTFGYFICFFERIVIERLPLFRHKAWFAIFVTAGKMAIVQFDFASSVVFRMCLTGFGLLLDYSKVNKERELNRKSFNSKQALKGLQELCKDHVAEAILIAKSDLQESFFANAGWIKSYGEAAIKEVLKQFKLEKEDLKKAVPRLKDTKINMDLEPMSYETRDQTQGQGNDVNLYTLLVNLQKLGLPLNDGILCDYLFTYSPDDQKMLKIKACPIVWEGKKALAIVISDLTEQYTILNLRQVNENKDKMVATVSHELRTPLNGILGMVQILQKEIEEPELQTYLQTCGNSARLLLSLVNSILDLAQINNNKITLNPEKYELADIMNDIMALFEYQCQQKNLYLKLAVDEDVPSFITTDKNRLTQIVINLIANALKFTFEGGILISITPASEDRITIEVNDTGIGIKEEDLEKLFQAFGKLENTAKMNRNGVGLGLNISDTLAKLLNGETEGSGLKVKSQENKGSTFFFTVHTDLKKLELEGKAKKIKKEKEVLMKEKRLKLVIPSQDNFKDIEQILGSDDSRLEIGQIEEGKGGRKVRLSRQTTLMSQLKLDTPKIPKQQQRLSQFRNSHSFHLDQSISSPTSSLLKHGKTFLFSSKRDSLANGPPVLVVDDSPFNLLVAKELIEFHGCHVETALNGKLAVEAMERRKEAGQGSYKLIFMDCEMPVMDGFEATKVLLGKIEKGELEEVNIVALTANSIQSVKKKCLKAGMVECLGKPLLDQELKEILTKYVKQ